MDAPTLATDLHLCALDGLQRINRASAVVNQLFSPIRLFAKLRSASQPITILDVASGGGDVPIALAVAAKKAGISVQLTMFDRSEVAITRAKESADRAGVAAAVICGDVVNHDLPVTADVITCSLFLHHLTESETIAVLERLRLACRGLLLISDLRRCVSGIVAAHVACRVLSRSPIVHFDGPVSARAAWTVSELRAMAASAGMPNAEIRSVWPFRMLLQWEAISGTARERSTD